MNTHTQSADESARLAALLQYAILDTEPDQAYDDLARLAAGMCQTPVAFISFIDASREWFKSRIGLSQRSLPRELSIGAQILEEREVVVLRDPVSKARFAQYSWVAGFRLYAAVPLLSPQGLPLGVLGVMDTAERELNPGQLDALRILGHQAVLQLEDRRKLANLATALEEQRRTDEALRQAEANYRGIFENAGEGMFQTTPEGHYLSANPMLARIYGFQSTAELMGSISDIEKQLYVDPSRRPEFMRLMKEHGVVTGFESQIYRRDGSVIWISETARAVHDQRGQLLFYEGTVEDITERKRTADRLRDSELLYHSLVENLPQNIFRKDQQGTFTFGNSLFCQTVGLPLDEIVGKTDKDLFPPELAEKYTRDDRKVMETGEVFDTVEAHQTPDHGKIYVHVVKTPLYDFQGNVVGIQGIFWDVTRQRRTEEELAHERDLLRTLLENIPDRIYFKDAGSHFIKIGRALANEFGLKDPDEAEGKTDFDMFDRDHAQQAYDDEQIILLTGKPMIGKTEKETWPDGRVSWALTTKMPMHNESGSVVGTFGVSKDITALKKAEAELALARDAAVESARLKSEFLANMSHEIRTPMNAVIGMTGLLLDSPLNEEQRDFAGTIRDSADALLTLINDILDFSKIEAGKMTVGKIDFDLRDTVESTVDLLAQRAHSRGLELAYLVHGDVPRLLRGDPGRLRQVLINLLGNAVKFTEQGEVVLRVEKESETATHATLKFQVSDTGIGVALDAQDRLFQAFTQADGSLTRKYGGTGLGLAICKQLIELMRGTLGMESELGKGSTFWFRITFEKHPEAAELPVASIPTDLTDLKVLVVDDNATNRQILHHQLKSWRMQDTAVASGAEALVELQAQHESGTPYQLVILDMQMPGMDGLTLARMIRANPSYAPTRLIMLTSLGSRNEAESWKSAGIHGYLVKPVKQSRLFDCIALVMASRNADDGSADLVTGGSRDEYGQTKALRILMAEDNVVNQKVALRQLEKLGYKADAVANGLEAVEAVQRVPYHVVLMDCHMPELNGYEAARRIRALPDLKTQPHIIALTANAVEGEREKCLQAGMDDYVSKPVQMHELEAALERAAERKGVVAYVALLAQLPPPIDIRSLAGLKSLRVPNRPDPLGELVDLFVADTESRLKSLEAALGSGDLENLAECAHSLKGSAGNMGAPLFAQLTKQLETAARAGRQTELAGLLAQITTEFARVRAALEAERAKP